MKDFFFFLIFQHYLDCYLIHFISPDLIIIAINFIFLILIILLIFLALHKKIIENDPKKYHKIMKIILYVLNAIKIVLLTILMKL